MRHLSLRAIAVAAATTLALGVGVSQAQAVTWTKTANTTHKAYATAGYKAKVGASTAPTVSGYSRYSTTVRIKNADGEYITGNVSSKWLAKGTYKVYSTFKYRKRVAHTAMVTKDAYVTLADLDDASCVLTFVGEMDPGGGLWQVGADCAGTYLGHPVSGSLVVETLTQPDAAAGDVVGENDALWELLVAWDPEETMRWHVRWSEQVTTYTWSYTNRYRYRYATVVKVTAPRSWWTNCTTVNSHFVHGVGKSGAVDKTSGTRVTNFLVSSTVYAEAVRANGSLDRDRDGIACERR